MTPGQAHPGARDASPPGAELLVPARLLEDPAGPDEGPRVLAGGGLLLRGGAIERVLRSSGAVRRAARLSGVRRRDAGPVLLTPGLVNAHAHLELCALRGALDGGGGFAAWIRSLLAARAGLGPEVLEAAAVAGARRALATGTTCVGDIAGTELGERAAGAAGLRARVYREVLDAYDPSRTREALARVGRALPRRARRLEGLSPHAPYTTTPALLAGLGELARARGVPVSPHWAESEDEGRWARGERGPLDALVGPRREKGSSLRPLERAGLLGPTTALVHGNLPGRGDVRLVAERGCTLVHCPGTHRFFGRPPFPWRRWLRAGVPLALGTDSLASNEDLDLLREARLARRDAPWLAPRVLWRAVTVHAARALGLEGRVGTLRPGACADLVAWESESPDPLEALVEGEVPVSRVWVGGRCPARFGSRTDLP